MKNPFLLCAVGAAALVAVVAAAVPDVAEAGGSQLVRFDRGAMQPVYSTTGGKGTTNYVLDYKVTNVGAKDVRPGIRLELRTETSKTYGDVYDAATWTSATKILARKAEPSTTAAIRAADLASGASADGLANFGAIDPNADSFQVRVYGIWDPVFRDRQGRTWMENRVLVLSYSRSGDEYDRQLDPIRLDSAKEELEGEPIQLHTAK